MYIYSFSSSYDDMLSFCLRSKKFKHKFTEKNNDDKQIKVVTTIFPEYDWVQEIAGEEVSHMDITICTFDFLKSVVDNWFKTV